MKGDVYMKKLVVSVLFIVGVCSITTPVQAHFLVTDKNIGAVLHVDPSDEPIAKAPSSFFFEFKDKENKFKPESCDCMFSIIEGEKEIFSQTLFQNSTNPSLTSASIFYTFAQKDVYTVKVVGKPNTPGAFQSFTLVWNFRVDQEAQGAQVESTQNSSNFIGTHSIHIVAITGFVILIVMHFISKKFTNKKEPMKGGDKNDEKNNGNVY